MLLILWGIYSCWGFTFIKEVGKKLINIACYLVAGNTVRWYYHNPEGWTFFHSIRTFFFKHIGSVIGGAVINGVFMPGDYFFNLITPSKKINQEGTAIRLYDKFCLPL